MLLERVDELTLQVHDFQGNPATLLASVIARIDRLKEAMVTADEVARWAAAAARRATSAPSASASSPAVYETHDRMLREQGALDFGDLLLRAVALLHDKPHVRARVCGALAPRARRRRPGPRARRACAWSSRWAASTAG